MRQQSASGDSVSTQGRVKMHRDGMEMCGEAGDACGVWRCREASRLVEMCVGTRICIWYWSRGCGCGCGAVVGRTSGVLGSGDSCMPLQARVWKCSDTWW